MSIPNEMLRSIVVDALVSNPGSENSSSYQVGKFYVVVMDEETFGIHADMEAERVLSREWLIQFSKGKVG